ncbi:20471_t:CDS:2, partial [Funneliformis geosporum]
NYLENVNVIYNNIKETNAIILKLQKLVKIHSSSQRKEKFARQYEVEELSVKELILDIKS